VALDYDNAPEWVVIYRNGDFQSLTGPTSQDHVGHHETPQVEQGQAGGETGLMIISPTSGAHLDTELCPSS
jgi:hypothetical protein